MVSSEATCDDDGPGAGVAGTRRAQSGSNPPTSGGASFHSRRGHCQTQWRSIFPFSLHVLHGPTGGSDDRTHSFLCTSKKSTPSWIRKRLAIIFFIRAPAGVRPSVNTELLDTYLDCVASDSYFSLYLCTAV